MVLVDDTFTRRATLVRLIDADTYTLNIDLGYRTFVHIDGRLNGVDTPERFTPEGIAASIKVMARLQMARWLAVTSFQQHRSFARWVVDIRLEGREDLAGWILGEGIAKKLERYEKLRLVLDAAQLERYRV